MRNPACLVVSLFAFASLAYSQAPAVTIENFTPSSVTAGTAAFSLTVIGSGYTQDARIVWRYGTFGALTLDTTFTAPNRLTAQIPAALIEEPANYPVAVTRPFEGATLVSNVITFAVLPGLSIATNCPLPNAIVGTTYSLVLSPGGGTPPYSWSLASGSLPPGLTLATPGQISGTPTAAASTSFELLVRDAAGANARRACSMKSVAGSTGQQLFITAITPRQVLAGSPAFDMRIDGTGFTTGVTALWDNQGGALPVELATTVVSGTQLIARIPAELLQAPRTVSIVVRQVVLTATTLSNLEPFTISEPISIASPCPLPDGDQGTNYSFIFAAAGGVPPYTWSGTGTLPAGLTLSRSGTLAGIPSQPGTFTFSPRVSDSAGNAATKDCAIRIIGPLSFFPLELSFEAVAGGAAPPRQTVVVESAGGGVELRASPASVSGGDWLRVTVEGTRAPLVIRANAIPGNLAPGVYRAQILVTASATTGRSVLVPVSLTVLPQPGAVLSASPRALRMAAPRGAAASQPASLLLVSMRSQVSYRITAATSAGGSWLSVSPTTGQVSPDTPALLRVSANTGALAPGTYSGTLTIEATGLTPVVVPVTLSVSLSPELLVLPQSGLTLTGVAGGPPPPPAQVHVLNGGTNGLFWEASSASPWLRFDPTANSARPEGTSFTNVAADAAGLPAQVHVGDVRINTAAADNSPGLISTVLQLFPNGSAQPVSVQPMGLVFASQPGSPAQAQPITLRNMSPRPARVEVTLIGLSTAWTLRGHEARTLAPGQTQVVEVVPSPSAPSSATATLVVATEGARPQTVPVSLMVAASPCTPSSLEVTPLSLGAPFAVPATLPATVEVFVRDNCGQPVAGNAAVLAYLGAGVRETIALTSLRNGRWLGAWTVSQPPGYAALTIAANDPDRGLRSEAVLSGVVTTPSQLLPYVPPDGVVSAASLAAGAPLAPGGIISIFGARLGNVTAQPPRLPLPSQLGDATVRLGERPLPLFYAGSGQVNAVLPYDLPLNVNLPLSVTVSGWPSNRVPVSIAATQPSIFTLALGGSGQAVAVDGERPNVVVDSSNPAEAGKVIVVYCEGLGETNPRAEAGQPTPLEPLSEVRTPVTVTIGGREARVLFAGLVPLFTGLYQVNAMVPEGIAASNVVPLVISSGGRSSPPATIAIR